MTVVFVLAIFMVKVPVFRISRSDKLRICTNWFECFSYKVVYNPWTYFFAKFPYFFKKDQEHNRNTWVKNPKREIEKLLMSETLMNDKRAVENVCTYVCTFLTLTISRDRTKKCARLLNAYSCVLTITDQFHTSIIRKVKINTW